MCRFYIREIKKYFKALIVILKIIYFDRNSSIDNVS